MGYAFINFIDINSIKCFYEDYHNKRWPHFNSEKVLKNINDLFYKKKDLCA